MIQLLLTGKTGTFDVTNLVSSITWSGDYQSCARTLEFSMLANVLDKSVPVIPCDVGSAVLFQQDGKTLFDGFVFTRQKGTGDSQIAVTCYDRGIYLKRSTGTYKFINQSPEAITRRICSDFGVTVGKLAATGTMLTRNFIGVELSRIILTAYTFASEKTGKSYLPVFRGNQLFVVEKVKNEETLVLEGGSNLMRASCTESVESMVNQVAIYDSNDKLIRTIQNEENVRLYGRMQEVLKQTKNGGDLSQKAKKLLKDKGYSQKMTVENLGNAACITGSTVVVREPYTGIYGLFWIDSDTHTWKNGLYLNKLTLNFQNLMDEQEAGSLPNKTGSKTAG